MDRIIRHIKEQLVELLPDDATYYRLEELRSFGFPTFIVQRIRIELERNLAESVNPPKTDWADMQSETVQTIWSRFVEAIRQEVRLPATYAAPVIETAVADVLDMLVQPRKNIPEVIFGADSELSYDQVTSRMDAVVVYTHFRELIPRYMQKKGVKNLTKERCGELIARADERLTARYSPLNWAQMLEPLFNLMDQQLDTNLLRLFFEDKNMPRHARQFDRLNTTVDRARLIEVLSSPESLSLKDDGEEQSDLFPGKGKQKPSDGVEEVAEGRKQEKKEGGEASSKTKSEQKNEEEKQPKRGNSVPIDRSGEDPIVGAFHKFRESIRENDEEKPEEDININTDYTDGEENHEDTEPGSSLNDIFLETEEDLEDSQETEWDEDKEQVERNKPQNKLIEVNEDFPVTETGETDEPVEPESMTAEPETEGTIQPEETPMWKRFMSPEEIAALDDEEQQLKIDEDGFIDEPLIDLTKEPGPSDEELNALQNQLDDSRNTFIDEIFRGSEMAYDEALVEIASCNEWRDASKYIEREVFKRNLVDMYSEAAVEFTDRLHTYFLKKAKS